MPHRSIALVARRAIPTASTVMSPARILALTLGLVSASCSRAPIVTIVNQSPLTLSNVVASGSGFSQPLGNIAPGSTHPIQVHPPSESGVRLQFDAEGRHWDTGPQGYLEPHAGDRLTLRVLTNLSVTVTSVR